MQNTMSTSFATVTLKKVNPAKNTRKFWTIQRVGRTKALCSWGRIGSWIQSKVFQFVDKNDMLDFFDKKVNEKLNRGYVVVS